MINEKFISKFLEKSFTVATGGKTVVIIWQDNNISKHYSFDEFKKEISDTLCIPNDDELDRFLGKWVITLISILYEDIFNFFKRIKKNNGSVSLIKKTVKQFKNDTRFSEEFITHVCDDYYTETYLKPNIDTYIKKLTEYGDIKGSKYLVDSFLKSVELEESKHQIKEAKKIILNWYEKNILPKNIDKFLEGLRLVLGPRNWQVKRIGYPDNKPLEILKSFDHEDMSFYPTISARFNQWYEEAKIKATENQINKSYR